MYGQIIGSYYKKANPDKQGDKEKAFFCIKEIPKHSAWAGVAGTSVIMNWDKFIKQFPDHKPSDLVGQYVMCDTNTWNGLIFVNALTVVPEIPME